MKKISVNIPRANKYEYKIIIGENLYKEIDKYIPDIHNGFRIALITDSNTKKLYGEELLKILKTFNEKSMLFSFPAGEKNKNRKTKENLEDEMLIAGYARDSIILALGGGVVGDISGFIASTYYRGIPYYQLPTTIIAMTDSSVGGKTGVDTIYGKNLIGTFYQPAGVIADISTLATLPSEEYFSGLAEVIKYGAIMDKDLFSWLESNTALIKTKEKRGVEHLIYKSCQDKVEIVTKDEMEAGLRKILNFGHTIGHAIEVTNDYHIKHGTAVAYGMIIESIISWKLGIMSKDDVTRIQALIKKLIFENLNEHPIIDISRIIAAVRYDKKVKNGKPRYVILERIGKHIDEIAIPVEEQVVKESIEHFMHNE